jgi:hypothetical protein
VIAGSSCKPVGITEDAGMQKVVRGQQASLRSTISSYVELICSTVVVLPTTRILVESLVWPFVVRRASREGAWFTPKDFGRFISSFRRSALAIDFYGRFPDNRDQTFLKYELDVLMCRAFQDDQRPLKPDWLAHSLFTGFVRRYVNRCIARRDLSFIYSLSKGSKRMWPILGEVKLQSTLEKHKERIGKEFEESVPDELCDLIGQTARQVFRRLDLPTKILPSLSACLQASRRLGGATSLFKPMETCPSGGSLLDTPIRLMQISFDRWRQSVFDRAASEALVRLRLDREFNTRPRSSLDVAVKAIPEPSKFRIITKGDGFLYTALQPLQGQLLSAWKRTRFSTMRGEDLSTRINEIDQSVKDEFWCSGDYEAATDLLNRQATGAALSSLEGRHPLADLAIVSMMPGWVLYPDGTRIWGQEGQYMGHPLSFPLLCVINLAVYRSAVRRRFKDLLTIDRRQAYAFIKRRWNAVIVNGDDILFKCDRILYEYFIHEAKSVGLQISVGKNYLSRDMCMINSQIFQRKSGRMVRLGYLNLKLIMNLSLKTGESYATPVGIARSVQEMCDLSPWTRPIIPSVFSRWNDRTYLFRGFVPNWYIPSALGGFGLRPDRKIRTTRLQRKVASLFWSRPELGLIVGHNLPTSLTFKLPRFTEYVMIPRGAMTVAPPHLDVDLVDDWIARSMLLSRSMHPEAYVLNDASWKARHLSVRQLSRLGYYRLSPMLEQHLEDYRDVVVYSSHGVPVPPLAVIRMGLGRILPTD